LEESELNAIRKQILEWVNTNKLIRFDVLRGRGVKQTLLGRVLKFEEQLNLLLVYNVDEKSVYNIKLNEIENVQPVD
jgi:hypothetical protein